MALPAPSSSPLPPLPVPSLTSPRPSSPDLPLAGCEQHRWERDPGGAGLQLQQGLHQQVRAGLPFPPSVLLELPSWVWGPEGEEEVGDASWVGQESKDPTFCEIALFVSAVAGAQQFICGHCHVYSMVL